MKTIKLLLVALIALFFLSCEKDTFNADTGSFKDDRDGNIYEWVEIGEQTWMAENLAYLPDITNIGSTSIDSRRYYVYKYSGGNIEEAKELPHYIKYGALYNQVAAHNICPSGWHLPTDDEWQDLEVKLGMNRGQAKKNGLRLSGNVGEKLKSTSEWKASGNGSNLSKFNGLPSGSNTYIVNEYAIYWTDTKYPPSRIAYYIRILDYDNEGVYRSDQNRAFTASVRCIKD
jgi:uncharacterized protein (TIGR02145 family)